MSAVDPAQNVSDLKRKLRLIKSKLLDPTPRNIRQAISMIDDTFATEEVQMNCSKFGITCTPPPIYAVPGYPMSAPISPVVSPVLIQAPDIITADAGVQTMQPPKLCTTSTQTVESGECSDFSKSTLYNITQANIQQAIELLNETKSTLAARGNTRSYITRSRANPPVSKAVAIPNFPPPAQTARPSTAYLERVQVLRDSQPMGTNMLPTSARLAIGDGVRGKYTASRGGSFAAETAQKRQRISEFDFNCQYCKFTGSTETELFYHDCNPRNNLAPPFFCCEKDYKHRGYYTRHRDLKHKKQNFD